MPRVFEITAASDSARAEDGRVEFAFNVKNTTDRSLRAGAKVIPIGNTLAQWLTIGGERERNVSAAEALQMGVTIAVPADAPAGKHSFRLQVYSVERPEEDFADSPAVTADMAPLVPVNGDFDWRIIAAIAAVVVVVVGVAICFLAGPKDKEPVVAERMGPLKPRTNRQGSDFIPVFDVASDEACRVGVRRISAAWR